jgi:ribulose-5-phosphate 4-epimerase/fuculose-1-phosphate aldolase
MLRNHGPVIMGATLAQAFSLMWLVNRACEVQLASMSMGKVREIPEDICRQCTADSLPLDPKYGAGEDVFAAMKRIIEKQDPSYKQ